MSYRKQLPKHAYYAIKSKHGLIFAMLVDISWRHGNSLKDAIREARLLSSEDAPRYN